LILFLKLWSTGEYTDGVDENGTPITRTWGEVQQEYGLITSAKQEVKPSGKKENSVKDEPKTETIHVLIWEPEDWMDVAHAAIKIDNEVYGYYPTAEFKIEFLDLHFCKGEMRQNDNTSFNKQYAGSTITSYELKITKTQLNNVKRIIDNYIKDPGTYSLLGQTCTSVALGTLLGAHIPLHKPGSAIGNSGPDSITNSLWYFPSGLADILKAACNSDIVSKSTTFTVPGQKPKQ